MSPLTEKLFERIQRWLPRLLPAWPIAMAYYDTLTRQLAQVAGSGG